jgi:hypothetical protein
VGATDAVEDDVDAVARESVDFFHELGVLVVDRDAAQAGNGRRPVERTGSVHLEPGDASKLQ